MIGRIVLVLAAGLFVSAASGAGPTEAPEMTIYSGPNFTGDHLDITGDLPNLRDNDFNDRASSVIVRGGVWDLYPDKNFGGRAVRVPPGSYSTMDQVLMKNNDLSSVHLEIAKVPPPPPPPKKLPDLQRSVDARSGYDATVSGSGDSRTVSDVKFRGVTAFVTVSNGGEGPAAASTLRIDLGPKMADLMSYISPGQFDCPKGAVPWPASATGGLSSCKDLAKADLTAQPSGSGAMTCDVPALQPGESARCVVVFSVLYNYLVPPLGDWSIIATADAGHDVKESDERNNGQGDEIRVKGDGLPLP